jgi:hypothetical protein
MPLGQPTRGPRRRSSIPLARRRLNSALTVCLLLALPTSIYFSAVSIRERIALRRNDEVDLGRARWGHGEDWTEVERGLKELGMELLDVSAAPSTSEAAVSTGRGRTRSSSSAEGSAGSHAPRRWWQRRSTEVEEDPIPQLELDEVEWWGNRDLVGSSPFDHVPPSADLYQSSLSSKQVRKRKRVLFLTGESWMCRVGTPAGC